ncbi:hypothetical protein GS876_23385 [Rhodococcus hoagii]|nr:hypothetical protein [Prescottella equi]
MREARENGFTNQRLVTCWGCRRRLSGTLSNGLEATDAAYSDDQTGVLPVAINGEASFPARILYEAMWCWADDYGIGETNVYGLLGFAFCDEIRSLSLNSESSQGVANAYDVTFYEVEKRHYFAVPSWDEHQKTQRKAGRRNPTPADPRSSLTCAFTEALKLTADARKFSAYARRFTPWNRGTGEQGNRGRRDLRSSAARHRPPRFDEFWQAYPRRRDRRKAVKAFTAAVKRASVDQIIDGAYRYAQDPNRQEQYTKYPEGWLNGDGWLDEPLPSRNPQRQMTSREQSVLVGVDEGQPEPGGSAPRRH